LLGGGGLFNNLQIYIGQEKNRKSYVKMFLKANGSLTLMGFREKLFYGLNCSKNFSMKGKGEHSLPL
jgi:hypothetical protein